MTQSQSHDHTSLSPSSLGPSHPPHPSSPTPSRLRLPRLVLPVDLPEPSHGAQLVIAQLDARRPNDAHVELDGLHDVLLRLRARVVPHDKVVAIVVTLLVLGDGAGQREHAPVVKGTDHAARAEDARAGDCDDSVFGGGGRAKG